MIRILAILLILIPSLSWGATYYATADGSGTTCSAETPCALSYAIATKATGGDTVSVAAGNYTVASTITGTAGITITGAGYATTIVTCPAADGCMSFTPANDTNTLEISGMTLQTAAHGADPDEILLNISGQTAGPFTKVKVHDMKFNLAYKGISLWGYESGVIYDSLFYDHEVAIYCGGAGNTGWAWNADQGGANYVFIENNRFEDTGAAASSDFIVETGQGGRIVFRYNDVVDRQNVAGMAEVFDMHGDQGLRGTVAAEIYNNSITFNDANTIRLLYHRGGKMMFFKNAVTGSYDVDQLQMTHYRGWAYCDADPAANADKITSSYYYNNTDLGDAISPTLRCTSVSCTDNCYTGQGDCSAAYSPRRCEAPKYDDTYIVENTHYYLTTKAGYSPYTCPHPLTGYTGSCGTGAGTDYYNIAGATQGTGIKTQGIKSQGVKWQ